MRPPTDWDATKQAAALQTVLTANPDLKGVFQQSDYALSPTLNVLKQAGRDAKIARPATSTTSASTQVRKRSTSSAPALSTPGASLRGV